jgi:hypothetical protein
VLCPVAVSKVRELFRRRWVRWVAIALLVPLPAFILVCNILLWTGGVEAIVSRDGPTRLRLEHGFAWTIWPTRIHLHGARFSIDAYSYQLDVDMDEALVDIRLLALMERRAHLQSIEADGVRAHYRVKVDREDANNPELAAYPPIFGTAPEVQNPAPKPLPPEGEEWTVDLDDVDAQVDALWIDEFDFDPGGHVRGGLHWVDGGDFSVTTTTVHMNGASLWLAEHEAIRNLVGEGTITIEPFDTSEVGEDMMSYVSFAYVGGGVVVEPEGLAIWWPDVAGMVAGERGPVEVSASVEDGKLGTGTRIHHHTARAEVGPTKARLVGETDLVLAVDDDGRPSATVQVTDAKLVGEDGELAHAAAMLGVVHVTHGDLAKPWALARTHVETGEIVAPSLAKLAALAEPEGWKVTRGSARADGVLDIGPDKIPVATISVDLDDAKLVAGSVQIAASVKTSGRVKRFPGDEILAEDLKASTRDLKITTDSGTSGGTWVRLSDTTMSWKGGELRVESRGRIEDARPAVVHLTRLDPVIEAMPDLERIEPITARTKLLVRDDLLEIDLRAEQLGLKVSSLWRKRGKDWRLAIWLSGLTAFGFTSTDEQKVRRPLALVGKDWYDTQRRWVRQLGAPPQG